VRILEKAKTMNNLDFGAAKLSSFLAAAATWNKGVFFPSAGYVPSPLWASSDAIAVFKQHRWSWSWTQRKLHQNEGTYQCNLSCLLIALLIIKVI
jgi:hypothetical protein